MLIHEQPTRAEGVREIRVRIPADLHVRLQSMRLLKGKSVSDAVTEALDRYFAEHAWGPREDRESASSAPPTTHPFEETTAGVEGAHETTELAGGLKVTIRREP
ncbi:MAG: hypothetical protein ACYDDF_11950 [Thermoplasmatota archaeon]